MIYQVVRNGIIGGKPVKDGESFDDSDIPENEWCRVQQQELLYPRMPDTKPAADVVVNPPVEIKDAETP